jgi:hypothetical protein
MKRLLPALLLAAACATQTGPAALSRFDEVERVGDLSQIAAFDRVYLAEVAAAPELIERVNDRRIGMRRLREQGFEIDMSDVEAKLEDLRRVLERELSGAATLVNAPGEGVLTIEVRLDQLSPNRPTQAALARNPSLSLLSLGVGGASTTITLSEDGEVLAVIEDANFPENFNDPILIGAGIWSTADRFFSSLGNKLAALLA